MTGAYLLALKRYHADCRLSQQLLHSIAQPQSKLWHPSALNEGIASVLNNRINRRRKTIHTMLLSDYVIEQSYNDTI